MKNIYLVLKIIDWFFKEIIISLLLFLVLI